MRILFFTSLLFLTLAACGKKEEPKAPCPACPKTHRGASPKATTPKSGGERTRELSPTLLPPPPPGEGMWPWFDLHKLDESALAKRGLAIPLKEIWTNGKGGLASAVVGMRGCTASFISPDGLLITNHHCAFRAIQRNSVKGRDLLKEGFLATSRREELNGYGTEVYLFVSQRDVTREVTKGLTPGLSDDKRIASIEREEQRLIKACEQKKERRCTISRENSGLRFLLLENIRFTDVRLVAAPPRAVGEYGGEVDNWRWPRHTLDFTIMRVYTAPDGSPAGFDTKNRPYRPQRYLTFGKGSFEAGDMIMVLGTPYRTSRYTTARQLKRQLEWYYPLRVSLFAEWVDTLEKLARERADARIPVQTWIKRLHNGLTNSRGQITGIRRNRLIERKKREEKAWAQWVASHKAAKPGWDKSLEALDQFLGAESTWRTHDLLVSYMLRGVSLLSFARTITKYAAEQEKPELEREKGYGTKDLPSLKERLTYAQRSFHLEADKKVMALFLRRLGKLPKAQRPPHFVTMLKGTFDEPTITAFIDGLIKGSSLQDPKVREGLMGKSWKELSASTDSFIMLAVAMHKEVEALLARSKRRAGALSRLVPPYLESLIAFKGKAFYPDANASPRVSFATSWGYSPGDGLWATPFTTVAGMRAKETGVDPFILPEAVLKNDHKHSQYVKPGLGDVPVCFLSNADTTGGNSGSPVLNGRGQFIGLNFDRVYENISGDYGYNRHRSRNIMVHVNAILWYLDEIMGAKALLKELQIAK